MSAEEEFRPWPRDPRYLVGDQGTVIGVRGRALPGHVDAKGYRKVHQRFRVHVMVAETWHGPRPEGHAVAHRDGDPGNNRAANLRWSTYRENEADKIPHDTHTRGERNPHAKLTADNVRAIRQLRRAGLTQRAIADRFGVTRRYVGRVLNGTRWAWLDAEPLPPVPERASAEPLDAPP